MLSAAVLSLTYLFGVVPMLLLVAVLLLVAQAAALRVRAAKGLSTLSNFKERKL